MVYPRTDAASAGHSRFGTDKSGSDFLLPFDGEGATAEVDPDESFDPRGSRRSRVALRCTARRRRGSYLFGIPAACHWPNWGWLPFRISSTGESHGAGGTAARSPSISKSPLGSTDTGGCVLNSW